MDSNKRRIPVNAGNIHEQDLDVDERQRKLNKHYQFLIEPENAAAKSKVEKHKVCGHAYKLYDIALEIGLESDQLLGLTHSIKTFKWGATICSDIMKCLLPRHSVKPASLFNMVCYAVDEDNNLRNRNMALKWITAVLHLTENLAEFNTMSYHALFLLMANTNLVSQVSQLLCRITTLDEVSPGYVQLLLVWKRLTKETQPFDKLLTVFNKLNPKCNLTAAISNRSPKVEKDAMKGCPFTADIRKLQAMHAAGRPDSKADFWSGYADDDSSEPMDKRMRIGGLLPTKLTEFLSDADEQDDRRTKMMPLDRYKKWSDLVRDIHLFKPPRQSAVVLSYPVLQHIFSVINSRDWKTRLALWLGANLTNELVDPFCTVEHKHPNSRTEQLLVAINRMEKFTQEGMPVVNLVLPEFLQTWDRSTYLSKILLIIERRPLMSFSNLCDYYLDSLYQALLTSSVDIQATILLSVKNLTENYLDLEFKRHQDLAKGSNYKTIFSLSADRFDPVNTVVKLMSFFDGMVKAVLMDRGRECGFVAAIALDFYEMVSDLLQLYNFPYLHVIPSGVLQTLLLTGDGFIINRLCSILHNYGNATNGLKALFDDMVTDERRMFKDYYKVCLDRERIADINKLVQDTMDILWRCRFASTPQGETMYPPYQTTTAHFCHKTNIKEPADLLSIFCLLPFADVTSDILKFVNKDQKEHYDAHRIAKMSKNKVMFLDSLPANGFEGVYDFIRLYDHEAEDFHTTLMERSSATSAQAGGSVG